MATVKKGKDKEESTTRIGIHVPEEFHTRLKVFCAKNGSNMSDFIREAAEAALDELEEDSD